MVFRAFTNLGTGDPVEARARRAISVLEEMTDEGEPVISAYRAVQDGPWVLDILFTDTTPEAADLWLETAREMVPDLPDFEIDPLAERDWVAESQRQLHPVVAGRFTVHGSHDLAKLPPSRWNIEIDAGRAFGTAHHASTKGCLIALERLARRPGGLGSVHDVGTGTGVLAIAAERFGAGPISAGDIDPVAVRVAARNVRATRTLTPIELKTAAGPFRRADTVFANILARPLIAMATKLAGAAKRNLVLSGLRRSDRRRVEAAYRARGLVVSERVVIEDWVTIIFRRPGGAVAPRADALPRVQSGPVD